MTRRYTGGFLSSKEQVTDVNSANGIYTTQEAGTLTTAGTFPTGRWTPQRSLRIRQSASAYLSRTPAVTSSTRTAFTYSTWVKRTLPTAGGYHSILAATPTSSSSDYSSINFSNCTAEDQLVFNQDGYQKYYTPALFRDYSAWYHVVCVYNSNDIAGSRIKFYVNGVQQTATVNNEITSGASHKFGVSGGSPMYIGRHGNNAGWSSWLYADMYMTETNYVDGQALDASYFGSTDPETGTWVPKLYTGTYGTNGFYLPFSNNGSTTALGLDMSPSKNIMTYSEQFDNAAWSKTNVTVTTNAVNDPINATATADKVIPSATNATHIIQQSLSSVVQPSTYYTFAVYAKAAGYNEIQIAEANTTGSYAYFDLTNGVIISSAGSNNQSLYDTSASIQNVGNGWYRCIVTLKTGSSQTSISPTIYLGNNGTYTYAGDTTSGIYFWGSQLNAGKFANTYVTTTSAAVTNDWTVNNVSLTAGTTYDSMVDVPGIPAVSAQNDVGGVQRGNYATLNPLALGSTSTSVLSGGNLSYVNATNHASTTSTIGVSSGKWYWEGTITSSSAGGFGFTSSPAPYSAYPSTVAGLWWIYDNTGSFNINNQATTTYSGSSKTTTGAVWQIALDMDNGKAWFGINNVWYDSAGGTTGNPWTGANPTWSSLPLGTTMHAFFEVAGQTWAANFGQRAFAYTPPTGFKTLNTTNLPNPVIKRPNDHFDTKLYSGNGTTLTVGNNNKQIASQQIPNSLRFRGSTGYRSPLLWRSFSTSGTGGAQKWTYSVWVKRGNMSNEKGVLLWGFPNAAGTASDTTNFGILYETNGTIAMEGQNTNFAVTTQSYIDKSRWHHVLVSCDTTASAGIERLKLYVDGVRVTAFSTYNNLTLNQTTGMSLANNIQQVGARYSQMDLPFDGFMAESYFVDGQALTPTSFGQFDAVNNWSPARYSGTYGTNGWYLPFTPPTQANAGTSTYAGHFDGSTQYLTTPSSANLAMGTGAFTVEFWMNLRAEANNNLPIISQDYSTGLDIRTGEGGANQLGFYLNSTYYYGFYPAAWRETWQHVAVVRTAGGALTMYVGGCPIVTGSNSANMTAQVFRIGELVTGAVSGTGKFWGSISNVRVVKGTAVYTSQFTPPTGPLTAISGTQLLALNSATPTADGSTNAFTLTNTGSVVTDVSYPMAKTVGVDASGNGNDLNSSYIIATPTSSVLTYGAPGTYTWVAPTGVTSVKALVVAGGGGGAGNGGGGGAGGMIYNSSVSVTPGTSYTVTVGAGGRGGNGYDGATNGQNSVFGSLTAIGGGRGACYGIHGAGSGGSGGGGTLNSNAGGSGTAGQGNAGGSGNNGNSGNTYYHGGGGGAGAAGGNGGNSTGGAGLANSITGVLKYYAGGGGGHYFVTNTLYPAVGGLGGGGDSSAGVNSVGKPNTGGGGGSNGAGSGLFSSGGSGVVILSYTNANTYTGTGANILDNHDIFTDSPTEYDGSTDGNDIGGVVRGSYAKFNNSIKLNGALPTVTNGGLTMYSNAADYQFAITDLAITGGKWYWEFTVQNHGSSGVYAGIIDAADIPYLTSNSAVPGNSSSAPRGFAVNQGGLSTNYSVNYGGSNIAPSPALYWEAGDIIQFALDADKKLISVGKNGTWVQSQVPSTGANAFAFTGSGTYYPFAGTYDHPSFGTYGITANFGQKQFAYTPPTGFKSINTKNLRDVGSYNLPDNYGNFVNTPDLVWTKARTGGAVSPRLYDTVRGPGYSLGTNSTGASGAETNTGLSTFLPNGFQLYSPNGAAPYGLENGYTYVAWCWNRGQTPGFDIVTYGGTGATVSQNIPHNLGAKPKFMIAKVLNTTNGWIVYHGSVGATQSGILNGVNAFTTQSDWNSTEPTSNTFSVYGGNNNTLNNSYIAYLWSEVPGFSKFGSYIGNGSSDGPFVYTGFRPRWILIKQSSNASVTYGWQIYDTARSPNNIGALPGFWADSSATEAASTYSLDILSNGFKIKDTNANMNTSGYTYVYAAFAETPFKYANAR